MIKIKSTVIFLTFFTSLIMVCGGNCPGTSSSSPDTNDEGDKPDNRSPTKIAASLSDAEVQSLSQKNAQNILAGRSPTKNSEKIFVGSNFSNQSLAKLNLDKAYLKNVTFDNATLQNVSLKGAHIEGGSFNNITLKGANFDGATIDVDEMTNVKSPSSGNSFNKATFKDGFKFVQGPADMLGSKPVSCNNAQLFKAQFSSSSNSPSPSFVLTSFEYANLEEATFTGMQLPNNSSFNNANLKKAHFIGMKLNNLYFQRANLTKATFENCTISSNRFHDAILTRTKFKNCKLGFSDDIDEFKKNLKEVQNASWTEGPDAPTFERTTP